MIAKEQVPSVEETMRRLLSLTLLALASACEDSSGRLDGAASPDAALDARPVDAMSNDSPTSLDGGGDDASANAAGDPRCPSQWAVASVGMHSELCASFGEGGGNFACAYPEGTCGCPGYCGGAAPPDDWKPSWYCKPLRTDGCGKVPPAEGSSCAPEGKVCIYGDCCIQPFTCSDTKWTGGEVACPP